MPLLKPTTAIKTFSFSYYFSAIFMLGFVPIYLENHGFSKFQIGSVYALGPFIGVFANLFWGAVSDRYQVVKQLLLGLVLTMLAIVITLNYLDSYSILLLFMVILFFAQTAVVPLSDSLTLLTIQPLGHTFASYRIYGSFGFAVAALGINRVLDHVGYHYTLWLYAAALGMVLLATTQLTERVGHQARPSIREFVAILKNKELLLVLISLFVIGIANRTNDNFIALYMHELGLQSHIGLALMCSALSEIPVFLLLSKYGTRFREVHLLAVAGLFYCVRYLIVAFEPSLLGILAAQLMHSVTFGIAYITAIRYLADLVPSAYRASGQALFAITFSGASGIVSGIAGGWLFATYSGHLLYLAMAGCGALAFALFLFAGRLYPRT
jgi:PPP family 3-phenylpropionic acid transporter